LLNQIFFANFAAFPLRTLRLKAFALASKSKAELQSTQGKGRKVREEAPTGASG